MLSSVGLYAHEKASKANNSWWEMVPISLSHFESVPCAFGPSLYNLEEAIPFWPVSYSRDENEEELSSSTLNSNVVARHFRVLVEPFS